MTPDIKYSELERLAYISGQLELARLYDKAAVYASIDSDALAEVAEKGLDNIKEAEYNRGYEAGKQAASDAELLAQVDRLTTDVNQKDENFAVLLQAFDRLLKWLQSDDAKTIKNRKQGIQSVESWLRKWR